MAWKSKVLKKNNKIPWMSWTQVHSVFSSRLIFLEIIHQLCGWTSSEKIECDSLLGGKSEMSSTLLRLAVNKGLYQEPKSKPQEWPFCISL